MNELIQWLEAEIEMAQRCGKIAQSDTPDRGYWIGRELALISVLGRVMKFDKSWDLKDRAPAKVDEP